MTVLKRFFTVVAMSASLAGPGHAADPGPEPSGDIAVLDLLVARPIGLLSVVGGAAVFVVALPFTIPSGSVDAAANELIRKPVDYTFKRPLGHISPSQ